MEQLNEQSPSQPQVTVYSKPGCGQCIFTKNTLKDNGVAYQEVSVVGNKEALHHIKDKGFNTLPVVEISDDIFSGYQPDKLEGIPSNG